MKNTTSGPEDSIFRKKGFFIALYSCLGAVAVLALVITIANFGQPSFQAGDYDQDAAPVGAYDVEPYRAQVDEEAWFRPRPTPPPTPPGVPVETPRPTQPPARPTEPPVHEIVTPEPEAAVSTPEPEAEREPEPTAAPQAAFTPFTDESELLWPVEGEILMHFSMDALVFDPTLVQFRTNDDLRIAAEEGTHVQASAEGRVLAIGSNVVRGNYVKIDHGNGFIATYGQLAGDKLVSVGDIVRAGQIIGTVGEPSIFGSLHGNHVNLHITRNDEPYNPYTRMVALGE